MKMKSAVVSSMLLATCLYQSVLLGTTPETENFKKTAQISADPYTATPGGKQGQDLSVSNRKKKKLQLLAMENRIAALQEGGGTGSGSGTSHSHIGGQMARFSGQLIFGERK